jgi:hypothetical protein
MEALGLLLAVVDLLRVGVLVFVGVRVLVGVLLRVRVGVRLGVADLLAERVSDLVGAGEGCSCRTTPREGACSTLEVVRRLSRVFVHVTMHNVTSTPNPTRVHGRALFVMI